jgi:hypothetical protein
MEGDTQSLTHGQGIFLGVFKKPHGGTLAAIALLQHEPCRHGAVHTAAHADQGGFVIHKCDPPWLEVARLYHISGPIATAQTATKM